MSMRIVCAERVMQDSSTMGGGVWSRVDDEFDKVCDPGPKWPVSRLNACGWAQD